MTAMRSPTLGELVQMAWRKNRDMIDQPERSLSKTLMQRGLWAKLQNTFFAPDADADALSLAPALTPEELAPLSLAITLTSSTSSTTKTKTTASDLKLCQRQRRRSNSFEPQLNPLYEHKQLYTEGFDIEAQLPSSDVVACAMKTKPEFGSKPNASICKRVELVDATAKHPLQQRCELLRAFPT